MFKSNRLFPFLLLSFIIASAVFSFFLSRSTEKKTNLLSKAVEEQSELQISEWVPIDLASFNQNIDKETNKLNEELKALTSQPLSVKDKTKRQEVLQRSLQIKQITKEEHNLMDENQDGQISYEEFNKRTAEIYARTYPLTHTTIKGKPEGLYDEENQKVDQGYLNKLSNTKPLTNNRFLIIVEAGIYQDILSSLGQYKTDIEVERKYLPEVYNCNNCTKEGIRELLNTPGVTGTVFVGTLPSAWFKKLNCFGDVGRKEVFPVDQYFMDLDGEWGETVSCSSESLSLTCFTKHTGEIKPEIFFGRITAPSEADEIRLINHYFAKNHNYRARTKSLIHRSLVTLEDDWMSAESYLQRVVGYAYPNVEIIAGWDLTLNEFRKRFNLGYEYLFLIADSNPYVSFFTRGGEIDYKEIRDKKPQFNFYNLFACSNARFYLENYMVGWYVFNEGDYGLAATGSTKTGSMSEKLEYFYSDLSNHESIGLALKNWLANYGVNDECWHLGMTLIGDPTLKTNLTDDSGDEVIPTPIPSPSGCREPAAPFWIEGPFPGQFTTDSSPVLGVRDISRYYSCFPHDVVFSIWQNGSKIRSSNFISNGAYFPGKNIKWRVDPPLPSGNYEWRANFRNTAGQTCSSPLIIPFSVSLVCSVPATPQRIAGPNARELITNGNPELTISDPSSLDSACYPHDVVFSIWQNGSKIRSSNFIEDVLTSQNSRYSWRVDPSLPSGNYEWRANLRNTAGLTCNPPLIIPFTLEQPTPTPTLEPTPTPEFTYSYYCSPSGSCRRKIRSPGDPITYQCRGDIDQSLGNQDCQNSCINNPDINSGPQACLGICDQPQACSTTGDPCCRQRGDGECRCWE